MSDALRVSASVKQIDLFRVQCNLHSLHDALTIDYEVKAELIFFLFK